VVNQRLHIDRLSVGVRVRHFFLSLPAGAVPPLQRCLGAWCVPF
jgi:hypothetical protein